MHVAGNHVLEVAEIPTTGPPPKSKPRPKFSRPFSVNEDLSDEEINDPLKIISKAKLKLE